MADLPEPEWITLSESARRAMRTFDAEPSAAKRALVAAFHDWKIRTRGRCRTYFRYDWLYDLDKAIWDRADVVWQDNEFTIPSEAPGRRIHTFSDVVVHREDLEEWINPDGTVEKEPGENRTIDAETKCRKWLLTLMKAGNPTKPKTDYLTDAKNKFGVGTRAFIRAWQYAILESKNQKWSRPGPKS